MTRRDVHERRRLHVAEGAVEAPRPLPPFATRMRVRALRAHARLTARVPASLLRALARAVEVVFAVVALVAAAPVLLAAAAAMQLSSPGPALYAQDRVGARGRRFALLKLRTMVADADAVRAARMRYDALPGAVFKMQRDPRVTRVGRVLRRYSVDELPKLWNLLVGDLSLFRRGAAAADASGAFPVGR